MKTLRSLNVDDASMIFFSSINERWAQLLIFDLLFLLNRTLKLSRRSISKHLHVFFIRSFFYSLGDEIEKAIDLTNTIIGTLVSPCMQTQQRKKAHVVLLLTLTFINHVGQTERIDRRLFVTDLSFEVHLHHQ